MMLLHPQTPSQSPLHSRKRKADSQPDSNERLSKRLSLLNLEQNGQKLYVPVENAQRTDYTSSTYASASSRQHHQIPPSHSHPDALGTQPSPSQPSPIDDEPMHLDSTKHKVYIYSLDDELGSESEADGDADADGDNHRVLLLPDIERHLRANRIPPQVLLGAAQPRDLEDLAAKQLVLYGVPSSISVPEEQDSVRKAIIEARQRVRERQEAEREAMTSSAAAARYVGGVPAEPGRDPRSGMEEEEEEGMEVEDGDADAMELD